MHHSSIDEIVDQYSTKIYNLAFRFTFSRQDAEDMVQETFMQVYKGLSDFRGESSIGTWIYKIAINNCLKNKKKLDKNYIAALQIKTSSFNENIPLEVQDWFNNPEKEYMARELTKQIRQGCHQVMMQELPDTQKIVFILRIIFDLSYEEISEILQIPQSVIKSRLKRARVRLTHHLQQKCAWFVDKENIHCCKSNIGFVLAQDTEILKRVYEQVNELDSRHMDQKLNLKREYVNYLFKSLPIQKFDKAKIFF